MNKVIRTIDLDKYLQILDKGIKEGLTQGETLALIKDALDPGEIEVDYAKTVNK